MVAEVCLGKAGAVCAREMRLLRRGRGQRNATSADVPDARASSGITVVRQFVLIANDDLIAGTLNRHGLATGHGNRWTRERVTSSRSRHRIPVHRSAEDGNEPWLNLGKAARLLRVAPHQGRWCCGKTPMQIFIDSKQIARDKMFSAA